MCSPVTSACRLDSLSCHYYNTTLRSDYSLRSRIAHRILTPGLQWDSIESQPARDARAARSATALALSLSWGRSPWRASLRVYAWMRVGRCESTFTVANPRRWTGDHVDSSVTQHGRSAFQVRPLSLCKTVDLCYKHASCRLASADIMPLACGSRDTVLSSEGSNRGDTSRRFICRVAWPPPCPPRFESIVSATLREHKQIEFNGEKCCCISHDFGMLWSHAVLGDNESEEGGVLRNAERHSSHCLLLRLQPQYQRTCCQCIASWKLYSNGCMT